MEYFRKVDAFVGCVYQRFEGISGDDAIKRFWLLSDHGFCGIEQEVYLNRWLQEEGYLSFLGDGSGGLADISPESKAFCIDPGRIYINARDRFPRGSVSAEEIVTISEEIAGKQSKLRYKDQPVIRKVLRRDDAYAGPIAMQGPDLVALSNYGFDLKGTPAAPAVFGRSDLTGMHTWDDAFVLTGAPVAEPAFIWDLSGAILTEIGIG
jgi:predicted AlkP superfamily phosphohydrolase/phosphomutase